MTLHEAADDVRRTVGGKNGVVRVSAGKGTVVVYVDNPSVGADIRSHFKQCAVRVPDHRGEGVGDTQRVAKPGARQEVRLTAPILVLSARLTDQRGVCP